MTQDLHQFFGIDLGDSKYLDERSWVWLRTRVVGCFGAENSRLQRHFAPPDKNTASRNARGGAGRWR